ISIFSRVRRFDSAASSLRPLVTATFSATIVRLVSPLNLRFGLEEIKEVAMKDMNLVISKTSNKSGIFPIDAFMFFVL
ncbi:hypothetical protein PanWU01x14_051860, partial [Parasponia andersonii]